MLTLLIWNSKTNQSGNLCFISALMKVCFFVFLTSLNFWKQSFNISINICLPFVCRLSVCFKFSIQNSKNFSNWQRKITLSIQWMLHADKMLVKVRLKVLNPSATGPALTQTCLPKYFGVQNRVHASKLRELTALTQCQFEWMLRRWQQHLSKIVLKNWFSTLRASDKVTRTDNINNNCKSGAYFNYAADRWPLCRIRDRYYSSSSICRIGF
jgi:hypothetical protein